LTDQILSVNVRDELSKNLVIHKNVKQDIIITTEDKIKLVLINTRKILISQRDWWTPLGLVTSLVTTICTVDFKETLGLNKDHWQAVFVMMSIFSAVWLINTIVKLIKNWGQDDLIKIIEQIKLKEQTEINPDNE
jgi:hypothetical protein